MTAKRSAGILLVRGAEAKESEAKGAEAADPAAVGRAGTGPVSAPQVLLAHMGGPFWARKDERAWSIPKGEYEPDEAPEAAARREFQEELGLPPPPGDLLALGSVQQTGGKVVTVWALAGDLDPRQIVPGTFEMEWPRGSGRLQAFPEIDRVAWLDLAQARTKIVARQEIFLDRLEERLRG
ncbi:NUDIX domain-containing protein [Streptomyces sp. NBS 14/10]|uniref:NUDIX domain-containing protein n=1 Tax=Streptomyces sp. NBS 14/10 TaxID=1945643 RepID=UPI0026CEE3DB